ncbi:MAG: LysR family transcriptional regulator [Alphaproteobacteria bacterium]|nr:LysR family transcriptional regulator [Alphaproteobacteria bacterium]
MQLDLDLLRTFVAICETGSFRAAADIVARTQSAVSLQVKKLEEAIGELLLDRDPAGIRPTIKGELLLSHARQVLAAHDDAVQALGSRRHDDRELRLGVGGDFAQGMMGRVLDVLRADLPNLTVQVVCAPSEELGTKVREGQVEIALLGEGEGLGQGPVIHRERCVWASGGDAHLRDPIPLAMVPPECLYRRWAAERLDAVGRAYRIVYTSYSIAGLQAVVRSGHAVTAFAESAVVPGMRILGEADGFPPLPMIEVRVERCLARDSKWLRNLQKVLIERLRLDG